MNCILGVMDKSSRLTRFMILMKRKISDTAFNGYETRSDMFDTCFRDDDYQFYEVSMVSHLAFYIKFTI